MLGIRRAKKVGVKVAAVSPLDRLIGHPLPVDTVRPQEELHYWDLSGWDAAVNWAGGQMEQRKGGRNRGSEIEVVLRKDADWAFWRMAAEIWWLRRKGENEGVWVFFEDPGDIPRRSFWGALVRSGGR